MTEEEGSVGGEDQGGGAVLIRIHVPDLNIHKCLQFYRHDLVWDVKQQCLASLPKELKESFNYGLFAPPCNGKAGKFLDEERPLSDYPFAGPVGYLELRYKRRLYKGLNLEEKQLKQLHTKSNLRRFLDYVSSGHTDKITKMCSKGLDPNFHCPETGETPLSMAALMKKPSKLLMALVNGGGLLDYRTKDGATGMHRAVEAKSFEAVKTMLDLGGSPNYKDGKGLTPLYLSVSLSADPALTQLLLHDHAFIGAQDLQGWHEVHQACRTGLVQHLEHLLYYGADMNARNASGNTPLHVCGVNNQESCARLLLFRGADKDALNFANQTPYQMAVIAGNMDLAEIIQNHRANDVVPYREVPKYNPRRRSVISRTLSDPRPASSLTCLRDWPPSPCPSNRSLPPFLSSSSCLSQCSSDSSYSGSSRFGSSEDNCGSVITDKSLDHSDITSDSSGVGTCNSGGSGSSYDPTPTDPSLILPGTMVVCVENFIPRAPHHLKLTEGDIIEVTGSTDSGFLEGSLRGHIGFFPSACVQEIRMKSYEVRGHLAPPRGTGGKGKGAAVPPPPRLKKLWGEPHAVILHRGQKGFGFILRGAKADSPLMELQPSERFPALQYLDDVDENGVADRAGLRKGDFILAINSVDVSQLSHEIVVDLIRKSGELVSMTVVGLSRPVPGQQEDSKPGSPASLDQGSNNNSAKTPIQNHFATLPRKHSGGPSVPSPPRRDPTTSLSVGRARAKSMVAALADLGVGGQGGEGGTKSNSVDSIAGKPPLPPGANTSTPNGTALHPKTASIRARPTSSRITASEIQEIFSEKAHPEAKATYASPPSPLPSHKIYASVAEMKRSKLSLKGKEEGSKLHKDFHSTPDLKGIKGGADDPKSKSLSQEALNKLKSSSRHSWACLSTTTTTVASLLDRNYEGSWKSIEQLPDPPPGADKPAKDDGVESDGSTESSSCCSGEETPTPKTPVLTDGEYRTSKPLRPVQSKTLPRRASTGCTISPAEQQTIINLVPPGQLIKVDVSKCKDQYASLEGAQGSGGGTLRGRVEGTGVMSSFKPSDSAKLYASPDDLKSIGYRDQGADQNSNTTQGGTLKKQSRSHSLPPKEGSGRGDYAQPLKGSKDPELVNGAEEGNRNIERRANINTNGNVVNNNNNQQGLVDPQKSLQEAKEKLRPVKPVLKSSSTGGQVNGESKIRIEVKQSPRLARKAEKTVTFSSESPVSQSNGGGQGGQPSSQMSHSISVDEIPRAKTSLKVSKSFPNDLGLEDGEGGAQPEGPRTTPADGTKGGYVTNLPVNPDSDSSEDSSDKTWILKDGPSSASTTSDSVQTVISSNAANGASAETSTPRRPDDEKILNLSQEKKPPLSASAQLGITHNFDHHTLQQFHQQQLYARTLHQQQQMSLQASQESNYGTISRTTATVRGQVVGLTKNAVSLVKLPPPMEIESEGEEGRKETHKKAPTNNQAYHTLQPQRSRSMVTAEQPQQLQHQYHLQQQQIAARQLQQLQGQMQGQSRQAEKSIEESLKLIQMHVAALKQDFPSVVPPPPEFGLRNQTPILAPPPEFSDARDTHEAATRFNQGHLFSAEQQAAPFNRQSPMYRSISHAHSSTSSMYSGYPTMTRQQYQHQQQLQIQHQQAAAQHHQMLQSQQQHLSYQTLRHQPTYTSTNAQPALLNSSPYGHYQALNSKSQPPVSSSPANQPPVPQSAPPSSSLFQQQQQQQHHPKCYYYQQGTTPPSTAATNSNSAKLHPVHRYTPDLYESSSGPRIVGTIPKKPTSDHYEVPHAHQQLLQQQQQQQQSQAARIRREFRNKNLVEWSVVDACDWLDSLFMPEYKGMFQQRAIDGKRLLRMDNATLLDLGVKKLGHRMNIEKSLKRYLPQPKT